MKKEKGFTLIELMIVVGILMLMSAGATFKIIENRSRKDYKILTEDLENYMHIMALQADYGDEVYDFTFDCNSKLIIFRKGGNIISQFELPESFDYEDKNGSKIISGNTTVTGNINQSFSLYTFDKSNKAVFKETFVSTKKYIKFLYINRYKPKSTFFKGNHLDYDKWEKIE